MAQERIFRVRLLVPSLDAIHGLDVDNECMPIRRREDGQIEMEAIVPEATLTKLRRMKKRNINVEVLGDLKAEAEETSKIVSRTNRYADGSLPRGLGSRRD